MNTLIFARRALRMAVLPLVTLLLGACSTPYRPPRIVEQDARFPGLIQLAADTGGQRADVLLVHGMCTHDAGWADQVVAQLRQAITAATAPADKRRGPAPGDPGQVEIIPATIDTPAGQLRLDALIWSPLTTPIKRQLCYDRTDQAPLCAGEPAYPYTRARLNASLKNLLIDDCIADALIYQGVAREQIQRRMRDAVLQTLEAGDAPTEQPLMVISESLGSKILFDTLLAMTREEAGSRAAQLAERAVDRLRFLVMAANQIPLLSLAEQPIAGAARDLAPAAPDSLQLLLQQRSERKRRPPAGPGLTLVAFSDPNDLLSYTLPPERYASGDVRVYNILVSNATTWLGLLERPDRAHLDYLENPDVGRLIACGLPASALCKQD